MILRNPELQRNLWLEITAQRLIAAPVIIGLIVFAIWYGTTESAPVIRLVSAIGFLAATVFWGARLAGQSLTEEFSDGTWDGQRISGLSAWDMLIGKMLGGASFAWYIGAWFLLAFAGSAVGRVSLIDVVLAASGLIALAVMVQSLSLLSSLLAWRKLRRVSNTRRRGVGFLLLLMIAPSSLRMLKWFGADDAHERFLIWFDHPWPMREFVLTSLLLFTGWALVGAHRAMRAELQFRDRPWSWIGFVLFLQIYTAGWINTGPHSFDGSIEGLPALLGSVGVLRLMAAFSVALTFAYLFVFAEPKDRLRLTRLLTDWRARRLGPVLDALPFWFINSAITVLTAIALIVFVAVSGVGVRNLVAVTAGTLAVLLYGVRDFAVVLWCNLSASQRRADSAAAVYLAVLYLILPALIWVTGLRFLLGLVQPYSAFENPVWLLFAAIWAAVGLDLLRRRWNTGRELSR